MAVFIIFRLRTSTIEQIFGQWKKPELVWLLPAMLAVHFKRNWPQGTLLCSIPSLTGKLIAVKIKTRNCFLEPQNVPKHSMMERRGTRREFAICQCIRRSMRNCDRLFKYIHQNKSNQFLACHLQNFGIGISAQSQRDNGRHRGTTFLNACRKWAIPKMELRCRRNDNLPWGGVGQGIGHSVYFCRSCDWL